MATAALRGILVIVAVALGVIVTLRAFPETPSAVQPAAVQSPANQAGTPGVTPTTGAGGGLPPTTEPTQAGQGTAAPAVDPSKVNVQVLNGTNEDGLAASTAQKLEAARYKIARVNNAARNYKTTTIFYRPDSQAAAQQIASAFFPGAKLEPANNNTSPKINVTVVVGEDQVA